MIGRVSYPRAPRRCPRAGLERRGHEDDRRYPGLFEFDRGVDTPRRARTSIAEPGNHASDTTAERPERPLLVGEVGREMVEGNDLDAGRAGSATGRTNAGEHAHRRPQPVVDDAERAVGERRDPGGRGAAMRLSASTGRTSVMVVRMIEGYGTEAPVSLARRCAGVARAPMRLHRWAPTRRCESAGGTTVRR